MGYFFECRRLGLVRFFFGGVLGMSWGHIRIGGPWGVFWEPGPSEKKTRQIPDGVFLFECRCLGFVWFLLGGVLGRYWGHIGGPWGVFWEPPPPQQTKTRQIPDGVFLFECRRLGFVWFFLGGSLGGTGDALGVRGGSGVVWEPGSPQKTHTNRRGGVIV